METRLHHRDGYCLPRPPAHGRRAEDLDRIPGLPPHTELLDGGLFVRGEQTLGHLLTLRLLEAALLDQSPPDRCVLREMTVVLGERDRPEPDLSVVDPAACTGPDQTWFAAAGVHLAVEVVSPDSELRDREIKPRKYAQAGIPHFWRVEMRGDRPVVHVYELDPATRSYALTGIHHDKLDLTVPFPLTVDLTAVRRRRPLPSGQAPSAE
jgi:hypothetical protein